MEKTETKLGGTILIVDDEPKNIQLLGNILQDRGYTIEFATSGGEALEWTRSASFDLVLLDIMMPEMDGFETCAHLKTNPKTREIPVIFLTAKAESGNIVKGFELGAVDYVTKPFHTAELLARVATHLELKHSRDLLKTMAFTDGLTKLFNHGYLHERLEEEISRARRHGHPLSVIMLDLDHFKQINDKYGHKTGDAVLKRIADTIRSLIRKEDAAGRYGGEEFVIILPDTNMENARRAAEKLRTETQNLKWEADGLRVSLSAGVCAWKNQDANRLIDCADQLLYQAKNSGRNKVVAK